MSYPLDLINQAIIWYWVRGNDTLGQISTFLHRTTTLKLPVCFSFQKSALERNQKYLCLPFLQVHQIPARLDKGTNFNICNQYSLGTLVQDYCFFLPFHKIFAKTQAQIFYTVIHDSELYNLELVVLQWKKILLLHFPILRYPSYIKQSTLQIFLVCFGFYSL